MSQSTTRRAAVFGAGTFLLAARNTLAQATPGASPAASGSFPVEIEHVYGTTVIASAPQRIVTLGWCSYDAVIALGAIPVAVPFMGWGGDAEGFFPWTREAIGDRELPVTLNTDDGIPFEAIVAVTPDVILAPYSGITQEEYDRLSQIAPTVAFAEAAWSGSWQEITLVCGRAMGLEAEAERLIAETDAMVKDEAAAYPAIAGKSFIYGNLEGNDGFAVYIPTDPRPLFLESIGMVPSAFQNAIVGTDENPYFEAFSLERASELIADVIVFWFTDEAEYEAARASDAYSLIPGATEGRLAAIVGQSYVMATSAFSSLSIEYALAEFLPTLNAAAENVAS